MVTKVKAKAPGKAKTANKTGSVSSTHRTDTMKLSRRGRTSTSRLSAKNQVTVPVDIVRASGLEPGDTVSFEVKNGHIVLKLHANSEHPLGTLIGAGTDAFKGFDLAQERSQMWPQ